MEPHLLEAKLLKKVEVWGSGSGSYSLFTSTQYSGADCRSHTLIPVVHIHEQLFAVLGVRWLSQDLCPRREEIPTQSKVGELAAKTCLDQLFIQYKCTVMDEINGHYLQLP